MVQDKLLHKQLTYQIRGILFAIHNELGRMCNEKQYGDALEHELKIQNIPYERETVLGQYFTGEQKGRNRVDFIIDNKCIIELKTVQCLSKDDYFQCQRYLASTGFDLALLINFRSKYLTIKRILNTSLIKNKTTDKKNL